MSHLEYAIEIDESATELYKLLWAPLQEIVPQDTKRIYIATDEFLAMLPFEALRSPTGEYLIESLDIVNVSSFRDLAHKPTAAASGHAMVFAGANEESTSGASDDGILTAHEILGLDLSGTELVVLSASDTALGGMASTEGVFGVCRAFHDAGARTVVSTLWELDDKPAAKFMDRFYDHYTSGTSAREALRQVHSEFRDDP